MIIYIFIGLLSGVISGLGIGGGTILIPVLTIFMGIDQHDAQIINLLYFIPTALSALFLHIKNKLVNFKMAIVIIIPGIISAAGGAMLAANISSDFLRKLFGIFLLVMGVYEFINKK